MKKKNKQDNFYQKKHDQGKIDWSLLPWKAIESAAKIMTNAIMFKGYGRESWKTVPEGFFRYWAAMNRHIIKRFVYNEIIDPESGEPHMGHVICNAAFVFEKDLEKPLDKDFYER